MHLLAPTRYPWTFNGPRNSRHKIERRPFVPLNKLSKSIEGVTIFKPTPLRRFDLVHAFNRIPLGPTPFVIGFESHLPRAYGLEKSAYYQWMLDILASNKCRGIFPISQHAQLIFDQFISGRSEADTLRKKTQLRYPNLVVDAHQPRPRALRGEIIVTFVGAHFARKGGLVALKLAQLARQNGAPIIIEIVSNMEMGRGIWTDPIRSEFFDKYKSLMHADNIRFRGPIDNKSVNSLLKESHFSLLSTFGDTFGYSAIESMAVGTPVIGTRQGALPEFIVDGESGILLALETNALGEWIYAAAPGRDRPAFEEIFDSEVERLARSAFDRLMSLLDTPNSYEEMSIKAHQVISAKFADGPANAFWDDVYERAV